MRWRKNKYREEAELDITSFMNLMIILVPVLLLSMVFARTTVLDLRLPTLDASSDGLEDHENLVLEVVIRPDYLDVNYPAGTLLKRVPKKVLELSEDGNKPDGTEGDAVYDFELLSLILQETKRQLREKGIDKRDILLLSEPDTSYQTLVSAMDSIRSYKTLVVTDLVDAVLFPDISLGDAPVLNTATLDHSRSAMTDKYSNL